MEIFWVIKGSIAKISKTRSLLIAYIDSIFKMIKATCWAGAHVTMAIAIGAAKAKVWVYER